MAHGTTSVVESAESTKFGSPHVSLGLFFPYKYHLTMI